MLNRIILAALLLILPARAQEAFDPATVMPSETVAYAEFSAEALRRGFNTLDIARALFADEYKKFFAPMLEHAPVEDLKGMKSVKEWVKDRAAIGVSGFSLRLRALDGKYDVVRFAPGHKLPANLLNLMMRAGFTGPGPAIIVDFEGVAVIEPGEALRTWLDGLLENPPMAFTHKVVQRGARQILTLKFEPFEEEDVWFAPEFHIDLSGDRWVIASSAELLAKATAKERRSSLRENANFVKARERHTSGERVFFAYADWKRFHEMAKPLLPTVVQDAMLFNGLSSVRNAVIGVSIVDGGIRESYGIGLDENPKGFWRLLDAFPPGIRAVHKFSARAVGLIALKLDGVKLDKLFAEVVGELIPGVEKAVRADLVQDFMALGIDFDTEILPIFGDERSFAFFPSSGFVPEILVAADLRSSDAFERFLPKLNGALGQVNLQIKKIEDGWKLSGPFTFTLKLHKDHLLGSTNPAILRRTIAEWDAPEKTMARDSEMFKRVMQGLNGGRVDDMVFLAYADIRNWLPLLLAFAVTSGLLDDNFVDPKQMPDIRKLCHHFSGVAIGVRRDKEGIAFESFTPTGFTTMIIPLFLSGAGAAPFVFWLF